LKGLTENFYGKDGYSSRTDFWDKVNNRITLLEEEIFEYCREHNVTGKTTWKNLYPTRDKTYKLNKEIWVQYKLSQKDFFYKVNTPLKECA
jgi:hypothetical protein